MIISIVNRSGRRDNSPGGKTQLSVSGSPSQSGGHSQVRPNMFMLMLIDIDIDADKVDAERITTIDRKGRTAKIDKSR